MTNYQRAGHLAYARLPVYQRRRQKAEATIVRMFAACEQPYAAFSLGKDSSAMLWLVATQCPSIEIRIGVVGETKDVHPEFDLIVTWWKEQFPQIHVREVLYRTDEEGDPLRPLEGESGLMIGSLTNAAPADGVFVGVRAQESKARRISVYGHRDDPEWPIYTYKDSASDNRGGMTRAYPLGDWRQEDVWATLVQHNIPVLDMYRMGEGERTTLRLTELSLSEGTVSKLRYLNPDAFNRLIEKYPELRRWA